MKETIEIGTALFSIVTAVLSATRATDSEAPTRSLTSSLTSPALDRPTLLIQASSLGIGSLD